MFTIKNTVIKPGLIVSALAVGFLARAADIEAAVVVSPVGDFIAEFKDIEASAFADGDSYRAKKFIIPWSKLKTGMSLRDKHAKDYFNAEKHPNIEVLESLGKGGKGVSKIKMNGVEKLVKGTYKIDGSNLIADIPLKLSEFNVKNINFKGAGVQDDVKIKMTIPVEVKK